MGKFFSKLLWKIFPQTPHEYQTQERKDFEKGGRQFRGIKGLNDKLAMIEGVMKRNSGN